MNITEALTTWKNQGNTLSSYIAENGSYIIEFIEDDKVMGKIETIPGAGVKWDLPQSLIELDAAMQRAEEINQAAMETNQNLEQ